MPAFPPQGKPLSGSIKQGPPETVPAGSEPDYRVGDELMEEGALQAAAPL